MSAPKRLLAPSILSADFAHLGKDIARVEPHCGMLHVDVMDGHFVPNITIGPPVVACLKAVTSLPLDCHLMIEHPDRYLKAFAKLAPLPFGPPGGLSSSPQNRAGHPGGGYASGVAINPATPVESLEVILADLDFVLVMSVNPASEASGSCHWPWTRS